MKGRIVAILALAGVIFSGCKTAKKAELLKDVPFPEVKIPSLVTDPEERAVWIAENMWNGLVDTSRHGFLCDSSHISGIKKEEVESKVGLYTSILGRIPLEKARECTASLFSKIEALEKKDTSSNVFEGMTALLQSYLYDPNSPVRNEDIWEPYVSALSKSPLAGNMALAYDYEAKMCSLNRVGTPAADFSFKTLDGRTESLYGIPSPMTLLFFSNPGCENCKQIIDYLCSSEKIESAISKGELSVVNIYIDENVKDWMDYAVTYPVTWHNGYDFKYAIRTDVLYNVRAIPSLYILDKEKKVIFKDAPQETVFAFLDERL